MVFCFLLTFPIPAWACPILTTTGYVGVATCRQGQHLIRRCTNMYVRTSTSSVFVWYFLCINIVLSLYLYKSPTKKINHNGAEISDKESHAGSCFCLRVNSKKLAQQINTDYEIDTISPAFIWVGWTRTIFHLVPPSSHQEEEEVGNWRENLWLIII